MNTILKLEELGMFALSIFLFSQLDFAWWWFPLLLFTPDLSMLGYLHNTQTGALIYNLVHHKAVGVAAYVLGALLARPGLMLAGVILFGHSNMDRIFGYGLKYPDSFQHTHLGMIGGGEKK